MSSSADGMKALSTPRAPLLLLVLVTLTGMLAMHIFVPVLPIVGRDLNASAPLMQTTISLYIIGLAVGQLIYGPLSDCFGRRPVLMVGLAVYSVAGIAAALAPGVYSLIAVRLLQALGGCAGVVLGRVIVRDMSTQNEMVKRLALMNLMTMIGPGLAPVLGTALAAAGGWRSIFLVLTTFGLVNLFLTWKLLPETGRPTGRFNIATLRSDYKVLLSSPVFVGFAIGGSCATMAVYAVIVSAPFFLVQELHRPDHEVGFFIFLLMVGMALGNIMISRLVGRVVIERVALRANLLSLSSALVFLGIALMGWLAVWSAALLTFLFTLGVGLAGPGAVTKAVGIDPKRTGTAAGIYGSCQMLVGAIAATLASLGSSPSIAAGCVLVGSGILAQIGLRLAIRLEKAAAMRATAALGEQNVAGTVD